MARKVSEGFEFVVKANRDMTHAEERRPEVFAAFRAALEPLLRRGNLGCVLGQFPWSFRNTPGNRDTLRWFRERMDGIPTVIEFRNSEWAEPATFGLLQELELGYCCVDEPALKGLMPRTVVATSPLGYVRFHGRNAAKWWRHEHAYERYDYLYSESELEEWVPKIRALAEETDRVYVFFNNHYEGKAGQNARMMARLLNLALPLAGEGTGKEA
jgi:uncharacterized protein YecE (DUF72 family)